MANPIWDRENAVFALRMLMMLLIVATGLTGIITLWNYPLYAQEQANAEACYERFGPTAEYVGETGRFGDPAVICVANGEARYIDRPKATGVSASEYIEAVLDGRA